MKIEHFVTHIDTAEDVPYLRNELFDVNMRLFKSSAPYRRIVQGCCRYLEQLALTEMEGYKRPHGMSGANIGIPFNIIAVVKNRNMESRSCMIMLNPKIVNYSKATVESYSNCGSIRLKEPIVVKRSENVTVEWFDIDGKPCKKAFTRAEGSLTIQHEVDHNLGILITDSDRQVKETKLAKVKEDIEF
jgi:peptide deformylase